MSGRRYPSDMSGCAWRLLPREFPPWRTVCSHFRRHRRGEPLRRAPEASGAVIDSQSVRAAGSGGPARG